MADFIKLKDLVGKQFTINKVNGYKFKYWDTGSSRMIVEDKYFDGARKVYQVETDKGTLDLGTGQIGNLLEATFKDGKADLNGKTFEVKSNGKEGMEIRYFFNLVPDFVPEPSEQTQIDNDLGELPF